MDYCPLHCTGGERDDMGVQEIRKRMTPGLVDRFVIAALNEKSLYLMHHLHSFFVLTDVYGKRWLQREDAVGPLMRGKGVLFLQDRLFSFILF